MIDYVIHNNCVSLNFDEMNNLRYKLNNTENLDYALPSTMFIDMVMSNNIRVFSHEIVTDMADNVTTLYMKLESHEDIFTFKLLYGTCIETITAEFVAYVTAMDSIGKV